MGSNGETNRRWKRRVRMEMEMEVQTGTGIQVLGVKKQNHGNFTKDQDDGITNLDEIQIFHPHHQHQDETEGGTDKTGVDVDGVVLPAFLYDGERRYTKGDLKYTFFALNFLTWIKLTVIGIDPSSQNYPRSRVGYHTGWENTLSLGWFFLASLRLLTIVWSSARFVLTADVEQELQRMTLAISISICFILILGSFFSVRLYRIQDIVLLVNSIFKYLDDVPISMSKSEPEEHEKKMVRKDESWLEKLQFHTLRELLIIHFPFGVYSLMGLFPLLYIFDPEFPILLGSLVPPESRWSVGYVSIVLFDTAITMYFISLIFAVCYIFFGMHRIQEEAELALKHLNKEWKSESEKISTEQANANSNSNSNLTLTLTLTSKVEWEKKKILRALKSLRLVQIWTQLFNLGFSSTVYAAKLIGLAASIAGGFGLIKMYEVENWPYVGIFAIFFIQGIVIYNLSFGAAFKIPETVEELKREINSLAFKMGRKDTNRNLRERKYAEKFLRSVPWLGAKDGVYKMERMTCVNYVDYAVQQIIDLVLAY